MEYFDRYVSNTYAGSSNQFYFESDNEVHTGRLFYKIAVGGKFNYSFLFTNIIDGTFADGIKSNKNLVCDSWTVTGVRAGRCESSKLDTIISFDDYNKKSVVMSEAVGADCDIAVGDFKDITFGGQLSKEVMPGEFFYTDAVSMEFNKGDYLCIEISFKGRMIPYHEETIISTFIKDGDKWTASKLMPFPAMIGSDRSVKKKIAYMGDSITQGIGTEINSYLHWNARLSEMMGDEYAYWNLGIGFGRASDAASNGAWLFKAKQSDMVAVCFGVNDILRDHTAGQIKSDLEITVDKLHEAGKKVFIQTVPPFDYSEEKTAVWKEVNEYIKNVLGLKCEGMFDNVPVLCEDGKNSPNAKYGGHPDSTGCEKWAEALYPEFKRFVEEN